MKTTMKTLTSIVVALIALWLVWHVVYYAVVGYIVLAVCDP